MLHWWNGVNHFWSSIKSRALYPDQKVFPTCLPSLQHAFWQTPNRLSDGLPLKKYLTSKSVILSNRSLWSRPYGHTTAGTNFLYNIPSSPGLWNIRIWLSCEQPLQFELWTFGKWARIYQYQYIPYLIPYSCYNLYAVFWKWLNLK